MANAIDSKGKKLNQVVKAEETLDAKKSKMTLKLQNLSLQDQVNFNYFNAKHLPGRKHQTRNGG